MNDPQIAGERNNTGYTFLQDYGILVGMNKPDEEYDL